MELTVGIYILLWGCGFVGGFVDSIAGGGGIITVPVLLALGFDPHLALGTNKLQACFGSLTASTQYIRSDLVDIRETFEGIIFTAIGAVIGTVGIQLIDAEFLRQVLPVLLTVIFFYMLFSPKLGRLDSHPVVHKFLFYMTAGLAIGFYDGFFGPGTGSFWMVAFVVFMGHNLKKATAHTKVMNATSNVVSLIAFIIGGKVMFLPGLVMGTGQLLGAWLGSHMVIRKGTKFVRVFFLCVVAITIWKLVRSTYF
jgi:uncharacterized membrane protein YfcA